jgi:hypothetical protein
MENREYTTNSSRDLLLYKANSLDSSFGTDRIRLKSTNILFDTFSTTTSDKTAENRVNRSQNRQLWIGDTAQFTQNTTNAI